MSRHFTISVMFLLTGAMSSALLHAQDDKWNNLPPTRATYKDKKPAGEAPKRDLTGIWDSAQTLGVSGVIEHPALYAGGRGGEGGHQDETGIEHPLPYTRAGLEALSKNKPSGPGVRQVDSVLTNDPAGKCDPLGFPYMFTWEFRTINVVQTPKQVIMLSPFYGNYRVIWTDGRKAPADPDPRYNGYSVGHWVDDYTFQVQTTGMLAKTWVDHAGRPHSDKLVVDETYHRISKDLLEFSMKFTDPVMYTEPFMATNKLPLHLMPDDFDIPELMCSPSEFAEYNNQVASPVLRDESKK